MPKRLRVVLADESAAYAKRVVEALRRDGYEVDLTQVERAAHLAAALDRQPHWDLVLANDSLPGFDTLSALRVLHEHSREQPDEIPLILISASSTPLDLDRCRAAIRAGACDCVRATDLDRLRVAVARELRDRERRADQQRTEATVRQAQKLEAVAQLAGGIAHDFNNLLTAILAYSESMLYQLPPDSPLRVEVSEIKKSGERASALIQRLLAFGRRRAFKPHVTNLNGLISGLEQTLQRTLGEHIDVQPQLASDLGPVRVDVGHLEQAILALVTNARDAMPAGGTLTVRTANVDLREATSVETVSLAPGWYVSLDVIDTGCGMDASTQARAFEPFFTTRDAGLGAGLGLPLVYGTIRQSGGAIAIESELGRGTTIHILLPRAQMEPEPAAAPSGHETILLIEDEELVRQMALLTLERRAYRVLVAADSAEAIARAQAHAGDIDLLIADLVMPRVSGQELARVLRQTRPNLRVLYMIGYGDDATAKEMASADPAAAFLQKPFVATALADRVREVLAADRVGASGRSPGAPGRWPMA